jgi:hypothetical protein
MSRNFSPLLHAAWNSSVIVISLTVISHFARKVTRLNVQEHARARGLLSLWLLYVLLLHL